MTTPARKRPAWPRVIATIVVAATLAAASSQPLETEGVELPVTRVVIFSTGVAYVEHGGVVDGDATVDLSVPPAAMDDLLQSLVVADLGGGRVDGVRYGTRDPLGRMLASYPIDLSSHPSMADILAQARGERVRLTTDVEVEGVVLGVERVAVDGEATRAYLTVFDGGRLQRVDLADVRDLQFESETLRGQIDAALGAIAAYRDATEVPVRIALSGAGEREVRVGYLREMPVWKTSYRLVLDADGGAADLQGWAIFDNPTSLDFEDVHVTFVAGQPASFVSALFEPVYADRPRVTSVVAAGFVPPTDAGAIATEMSRSLMAAPAPAPAAMMSDGFAAEAEAAVGSGVEALAEGGATGATFSYTVRERVTVRRFESVLVPIVRADVTAFEVAVFDPRVDARHPLRAVRIVNDTGLHLAPGPVTVFDVGGFTGTALVPDLVPGDDRLLAYAVDLEIAVDVEARSEPERVVSVRFDGGLLVSEHRSRILTTYRLAPMGDVTRFVVIEHPRRGGFEVVSPAPAPTATPNAYRFGVSLVADGAEGATDPSVAEHARCDGAETCALRVVLERVESRRVAVVNVPLERIEVYLSDLELDDATRAQLEAIASLQRELVRVDRAVADERARRVAIVDDQARVRQNMAALDRNAALYRRYVEELTDQEDTLAEIADRLEALASERAELQEALDALVRGLGGE
jgi:hypothetical protein